MSKLILREVLEERGLLGKYCANVLEDIERCRDTKNRNSLKGVFMISRSAWRNDPSRFQEYKLREGPIDEAFDMELSKEGKEYWSSVESEWLKKAGSVDTLVTGIPLHDELALRLLVSGSE